MKKEPDEKSKEEYLNENAENRSGGGEKIQNRIEFRNSTRFLLDTKKKIIHDSAGELARCNLDRLFKNGSAETYAEPLASGVLQGLAVCPWCIGKSAYDAFDGKKSILFTIFIPDRNVSEEVNDTEQDDIQKSFNKEVSGGKNSPIEPDTTAPTGKIDRIIIQARRRQEGDLSLELIGDPDITVSFETEKKSTLSRDDDVFGIAYFPKDICQGENDIRGFQDATLYKIISSFAIRRWLSGHFAKYGYRDLSLYYHITESIDLHTLHRETI